MAMAKGYQTVLGESGVDLSGGQRQRLALARARLLEPPILILDDPTASVDARTEREIVAALRAAMAGRTTFVVASRLSLLRRADRILVLEGGRLTQTGTHAEIVRLDGPYREAAMLQLMDLGEDNEGSVFEFSVSSFSFQRQLAVLPGSRYSREILGWPMPGSATAGRFCEDLVIAAPGDGRGGGGGCGDASNVSARPAAVAGRRAAERPALPGRVR